MSPRSEARYQRVKNLLQYPMIGLAVLLAALLLVPLVFDASESTEQTLHIAGWIIWGLFLSEYLLLLWLAPSRKAMIREHPLELLLLIVPPFRPLRALRLVGLFAGAGAAFSTLSKIASRRGFQWFFVAAAAIIGFGALGVLAAERNDPASQITDIGDALWWAVVTCTTVGYGDLAPVTPAGRVVAVVLMILGISIVSVVTANVASVLVEEETESDIARLEAKIDRISDLLEQAESSSRSRLAD